MKKNAVILLFYCISTEHLEQVNSSADTGTYYNSVCVCLNVIVFYVIIDWQKILIWPQVTSFDEWFAFVVNILQTKCDLHGNCFEKCNFWM